jgi:hypothetical protein
MPDTESDQQAADVAIKGQAQDLKLVDGLFLTDAAFKLRLHPKPADADKPII